MKQNILKSLGFIFCFVVISLSGISQKSKANRDTDAWRYEIEVVQEGVSGTYLVKIWSYNKKPNIAIEQAKKNAIHAIIFRGFPGSGRIQGKPPLTNNVNLETEKADFFNSFFSEGGKYMKFVAITNDGAVAAEDIMRIGKEYKVGVIVSVNVTELRKDLESAGVIRGLSDGF